MRILPGHPDAPTGIRRHAGVLLGLLLVAGWMVVPSRGAENERRGGERIERRTSGILESFVREIEVEKNRKKLARVEPGLSLKAGDQLQTMAAASAIVLFPNEASVSLWEHSVLVILRSPSGSLAPSLLSGEAKVASVGPTEHFPVTTPGAQVTHNKTEFIVRVDDGTTTLRVLDGEAELANELGRQTVRTGEAAVAEPGQAPRLLPVLEARRHVQWWIYYPAVIDPHSALLRSVSEGEVRESWEAYRRGNLVEALHRWPGFPQVRAPRDASESALLAALWLGVGHVDRARERIVGLPEDLEEARALRRLIGVVQMDSGPVAGEPRGPSEWLARSYELQGEARLDEALAASERALADSTRFGFAAARRSELLFASGRLDEASRAAATALEWAPEHAEAWVTLGFHELSRHRFDDALAHFDRALLLQPRLGDAWLGRGLTHWRRGRSELAMEDLRMAISTESNRSLFRSYLGKAFAELSMDRVAREEFRRARELDPSDPTPWLYEALLDRANNQPLPAWERMRVAEELNDRRAVFRSRHLLDEDRSVRSANFAGIYADLGLERMAETAGAQAIMADPANYSAHAFLADTYQQRRDPRQGDLRYETPWLSEYLVANLLAPPGAGILSQSVSQNEYSRLLQRDGVGVASETWYRSSGSWSQGASQFGAFGGTEYAADVLYRTDPGPAPNRDFEDLTLSVQMKQQLSAKDSVFLQGIRYEAEGGDTGPSMDGTARHPGLRFEETQEPQILLGYHRAWSPTANTLFLAARLRAEQSVSNSLTGQYLTPWDPGAPGYVQLFTNRVELGRSTDFDAWSLELQHRQSFAAHDWIVGARAQWGEFDVASAYYQPGLLRNLPGIGAAYRSRLPAQHLEPEFGRYTAYAYEQWRVFRWLTLVGGLTFDHLDRPLGLATTPLVEANDTVDAWSPSVGFLASLSTNGVLRGAWARSLGGVAFEQSVRLEPVQVAGFIHGWRSLMPESLPAQSMETFGLAYDHRFPTRTWFSAEIGLDEASSEDRAGVVRVRSRAEEFAGWMTEEVEYRRYRARAEVHQGIGDQWVIGIGYAYSNSDWDRDVPDYPGAGNESAARLHQALFSVRWFHPTGFFAEWDARWTHQDFEGADTGVGVAEHWAMDVYAGWRGWQRRLEITVGIENLTDEPPILSPVSGQPEGVFERMAVVGLRVRF
ncbi:MAG: FecR domain-containing protein [Verrucomicrobiales bacterium]|nr:FecR domain-containing protein [Verrucomicrobiales bacterium]